MARSANVLGQNAVVVGSGIAGLLAARVLSNHFKTVFVIEREKMDPDKMELAPRKGAPQGRHIHILLKSGEMALTSFFPGLSEELLDAGALKADFSRDIRWHIGGGWKPRFEGDLDFYLQTRPLLEALIRERVKKIGNVFFQYGWDVADYLKSDDGTAVSGVRVKRDGELFDLDADFVVETGGRGALMPRWLLREGYGEVPVDEISINLAYCSAIYERPEDPARDWVLTAYYPDPVREVRGGVVSSIEGGRWQVTIYGYHGDHPPTDEEGFLAFAKTVGRSELYDSIVNAKRLTPIVKQTFPASLRRRYEKMQRLPERFIAVGDAILSNNPAFAQGISATALEAALLDRQLRACAERQGDKLKGFSHAYFEGVSKVIDVPWDMAAGETLKFPQATEARPFGYAVTRWFKDKIMSSGDPVVVRQFYRVMHLVDSPLSFLNPMLLARAFLTGRQKRPAKAPQVATSG